MTETDGTNKRHVSQGDAHRKPAHGQHVRVGASNASSIPTRATSMPGNSTCATFVPRAADDSNAQAASARATSAHATSARATSARPTFARDTTTTTTTPGTSASDKVTEIPDLVMDDSFPQMKSVVNASNLRQAPNLNKTEELIRVRKKRKEPKKGKKAALIALAVFLGLVLIVGVACALYINSISQAMSFDDEEEKTRLLDVLDNTDATSQEKPFYMLLLGSDARETDTASRSDVMILLRVDPELAQITMISIPRDTMVDLPGYGRSKINAAYAYGGAAGAVEAVNNFAGVSISHYAEIHFEEMVELVDALGGVWVDVPVSNDETGSSNTGTHIEAGEQLLDGETALAFARERYGYTRGDFQRADNQKLLLKAIIKQVLEVAPIDLPGTIQQLAQCVTTDYSLTDIVALAQKFQSAGDITFYSATVPSSTATLDSVSYVITDYTAWTEMMQKVDAGADPNAEVVAETATDADAAGDAAGDATGDAAATDAATGEAATGDAT